MRGERLSGWRKIANALWDEPDDPQIYGALELDATGLLAFVRQSRDRGERVTPTHLVGRAVGLALKAVPELNVRLVGDRAIPRGSIDVFYITAVERGRDLSGVKIKGVDQKSAVAVARELDERSGKMKRGQDPDFARAKRMMEALPRPVLRVALKISAWAASERDMDLPSLGVRASPFGGAMVSSLGMFGIPTGFAPLTWMYRVPLLVLVGEIGDKPVAVEGRVEVRPVLPLAITLDHRYVDGARIAVALRALKAYVADPAAFEPASASLEAR